MQYFKFEPDIHAEHGIAGDPPLPDGVSFLSGREISVTLPDPLVFTVTHPPDRPPQHLLGHVIPVASRRLVEALHAAGVANVQTFPAVLRNEATGQRWADYFAFNVIGLIDAADMSASTYDRILGDSLVGFRELVLDGARLAGELLFRLPQSPTDLYISGRVRTELIARRPPEGSGITTTEIPTR